MNTVSAADVASFEFESNPQDVMPITADLGFVEMLDETIYRNELLLKTIKNVLNHDYMTTLHGIAPLGHVPLPAIEELRKVYLQCRNPCSVRPVNTERQASAETH